jgi:PAS domain S-box-containing protein
MAARMQMPENSNESEDLVQRKMREALDRQMDLLQKTFDSMTDAVFILDDKSPSPTILDCNRAASKLFGYEKQEMIGRRTAFLHVSDETLREFRSLLYAAAETGSLPFQLHEFHMRRKDGSIFPSDHSVTQLLNDKKERVGWVSIVRDITEQKKMEEKLGALHRHASQLNAANNLDEIINHTLDAIEFTLGFQYAGFEMIEDGVIRIKNARGLPASLQPLPLDGLGVVAKAAKTKTTLRIADTRREPAFVDTGAVDREGRHIAMLSELAVPLLVDGEVVAVLNVESAMLDAFTWVDQMLLETLAMHVSSAIGRLRQMERLHQRAEELAVLQATVLDITSQRDLPTLLQTIVQRAAKLLDAPAGGMYLCDAEKQEARCVVSYNTPYDYAGTVLRYGEGAAGIVAQTRKPLIVDNYRDWQGRASVYEKERPFGAVLTVPMTWHGQVKGVIHVLDDAKSRHFTQTNLDLLTLLANHATIAVENARLLEEERRHAEELTLYSTNLEQLIAERTRKLAESERRFRELTELLPQIVFEIDSKGNLVFLNQIGFASTGYSEEDVRNGLNAFQMFAPEDHERARQNIQKILSGDKSRGDQYTVLRKDGSAFPAIVYSAPVMRENRPVGLRGVVVDITQRQQMEEELRSARGRLEYVVKSNPAVIYAGKPRADLSDWYLTYVSERVSTMLGFEPREFIGHLEFWERHVHPEDLRPTLAEVPRLWKEGHHTFEYRFLHKDGAYRWIREEAKVIRDADGMPIEVNGYWTDVTERRRLEEALLKSQRMAAIGELAAMVAHDLRSPMTGILGAAYYLKTKPSSKIGKEGKQLLHLIEECVEHSNTIISDLLEYSREIRLELTRTDAKSLTRDALPVAKIPRRIRVVDLTKKEPGVEADVDKMRRVFVNIMTNAVDAMPKGGTLTVTSKKSGDNLQVTFTDTGVGMSAEVVQKLWNPLFTTKTQGTGLGLMIVKRLVEAHGGRIWAESPGEGKGATFTLALPRRR